MLHLLRAGTHKRQLLSGICFVWALLTSNHAPCAKLHAVASATDAFCRRPTQKTTVAGNEKHVWFVKPAANVSARAYRSLLLSIHAPVPDSTGRFAPLSPDAPKPPRDWLKALRKINPRKLTAEQQRAYCSAVAVISAARNLTTHVTAESAPALLRLAFYFEGAFRDECGRLLRKLGPYAVPALVRTHVRTAMHSARMRRYAAYQLDSMDLANPEVALSQADLDLVSDILHAYGEAKYAPAVTAVIDRIDHTNRTIRQNARWATVQYLSGTPPHAKRRLLKMVGGKTTERERALYFTYRQLACRMLEDRLQRESPQATVPFGGAQACSEKTDAAEMAERVFAVLDERRAKKRRLARDKAIALAAGGKIDQALVLLDNLLIESPFTPPLPRVAAIYAHSAKTQFRDEHYAKAAEYAAIARYIAQQPQVRKRMRAIQLLAQANASDKSTAVATALQRARKLDPDIEISLGGSVDAVKSSRTVLGFGIVGLWLLTLLSVALHIRRGRKKVGAIGKQAPQVSR